MRSKAGGSGLPAGRTSVRGDSLGTTGKRFPGRRISCWANSGAVRSGENGGRRAGRRMVARLGVVRARQGRRHPPLEVVRAAKGVWTDEAGPSENRGPLVQVDARGADVACARPVRVPDMR